MSQQKNNISKEELESLQEAFTLYDTNNKGFISLDNFAKILKSLKYSSDDAEIKACAEKSDVNQDKEIDFNEFLKAMVDFILKEGSEDPEKTTKNKKKQKSTHSITRYDTSELQLCFNKFDKNNDKQIDRDELKEVMAGLGEKLTEEDIDGMMKDADTNRDGFISFEEFKDLCQPDA